MFPSRGGVSLYIPHTLTLKAIVNYHRQFPNLSHSTMSAPNEEYQPGTEGLERGTTADTTQNDYKSRTGQSHIPVVGDEARVEDPIDETTADSDAQLGLWPTMCISRNLRI